MIPFAPAALRHYFQHPFSTTPPRETLLVDFLTHYNPLDQVLAYYEFDTKDLVPIKALPLLLGYETLVLDLIGDGYILDRETLTQGVIWDHSRDLEDYQTHLKAILESNAPAFYQHREKPLILAIDQTRPDLDEDPYLHQGYHYLGVVDTPETRKEIQCPLVRPQTATVIHFPGCSTSK